MVSSIGTSGQLPVTLNGLVSGLDTKTLIQQIMAADRAALQPIQGQVTRQQTRSAAYQAVIASLTSLLSAAQNFSNTQYLQGAAVNVAPGGSAPTISATASAGASLGTYQVMVDTLASATTVSSPSAIGAAIDPAALLSNDHLGAAVTAGTLTVNGQQVSIDPTTDTLNSVIAKIQAAAPGTTASLVADSGGRLNKLQISNAGGVDLGSGGDTSNFLSALSLLASPPGTTRTSTANLGVVQTGGLLQGANLATALSATSGSFAINGTTITWDATRDGLSAVLSRINSSTAGVTASYNSADDTITLASRATGSTSVRLQDVSGNFLTAVGLAGTSQHVGTNAKVEVNAGGGNVTHFSTSNTVTDAIPGVTLNLLKQTGAADTVAVSQDVENAAAKMSAFVSQYNSTLDLIAQLTSAGTASTPAYNGAPASTPPQNGPLAGDYNIQQIGYTLHQIAGATVDGTSGSVTSISQIGLSFGAVGSSAGTTNHLVLNDGAFRAALQNNATGVANFFAAFSANATLQPGGTNVSAIAGSPTGQRTPGTYQLTTVPTGAGAGTVTSIFSPADGSPATTSVANVTAGASNTTLIPGMTLTFAATLQAGTDSIAIGTPTRGLEAKLEQFLNPLTATGGQLSQLQSGAQREITRLNDQIATVNKQLTATQARLQAEFARMEQSIQLLSQQRSSLTFVGQQAAQTGL